MNTYTDPNDLLANAEAPFHERLRDLRDRGPIIRLSVEELTQVPGGSNFGVSARLAGRDSAPLCVGRDAVLAVVHDEAGFMVAKPPPGVRAGKSLINTDDDDHRRLRGIVGHAFRPRAVQFWRSSLIEPLVHELIDTFSSSGKVELNRDFAAELPIRVVAEVLGLPTSDYAAFRQLSFEISLGAVDPKRAMAAGQALRRLLGGVVQVARVTPSKNVVGDLVTSDHDGDHLSDDEVIDVVAQLIVAGTETTYRTLGTTMFALLHTPDALDRVTGDPSQVTVAIEEALRWDPPFPLTLRIARQHRTIEGVDIVPGDAVLVSLASANRDERYIEDPHRFRLDRPASPPHLAFGAGPHVCIGAPLARLELEIAVAALLDRLRNPRIDPDATPCPTMRGGSLRGPSRVPILFEAA